MLISISRMPLKLLGLDTFLKSTGGFFCILPSLLTTSSCELGWGYTLVWLCRVLAAAGAGMDLHSLKMPLAAGADIGHPPWKPTACPASPGCRATKTEWECLSSSLTALWLANRKKCGLSYIFFSFREGKGSIFFILEQSLFTVQEAFNYCFKP